jgi:hypothetical protein
VGEQHGQDAPTAAFVVKVEIKDGPSNCHLPSSEIKEIFPPGEDSPLLQTSFGSSNPGIDILKDKFFDPRLEETGILGSVAIKNFHFCPLTVTPPRTDRIIFSPLHVDTARFQATFLDKKTNLFYQTDPRDPSLTVPCASVCSTPPCEFCVSMVEESSLPDDLQFHHQLPPEAQPTPTPGATPPTFTVPDRGFDINPNLLNKTPLTPIVITSILPTSLKSPLREGRNLRRASTAGSSF